MTPDYASPEQVRGEAVSTATDVYSLGTVLYELLTGQRPYSLRNYNAAEVARAICEGEIRPPSTLGNRRLRGELDLIVMKAMQKDPGRRYASVVEFSEDIRRHLEGLPIAARPDTAVYRARKFERRNRIGVAAAAAVVMALAVGLAVSAYEARIAQRRFAQVRELANTFLFQFYDQVTPLAGSVEVRKSIVDTARKYLDGLSQEAGNDKALILELAQAYQRLGEVQGRRGTANLGQVEEARRNYQRAVDLYGRLRVNGGSPPELRRKMAETLWDWGRLEYNTYHKDVAESVTLRMLDLLKDAAPDDATRILRARGEESLGEIRGKEGHTAEAVTLLESARNGLVNLRSKGHSDKSLADEIDMSEQRLARAKAAVGDLDGALNALLELVPNTGPCDERAPPGKTCRTLSYLLEWTANVYADSGAPNLNEPSKAAQLLEQAAHIQERIAALDPHDRQARSDLAFHLGRLGDAVWQSDPKRALELYKRVLGMAKELASKEQYQNFEDAYLAAIIRPLIQLGRLAEARKALTEELQRSEAPKTYADRLHEIPFRLNGVSLLVAEGNRGEARQALDKLIGDVDDLRASRPGDLSAVYFLSECYRLLASMTSGQERREALLKSAAVWHSWPATSYTKREEQKDLAAVEK
jgi:tetratricopeptide (TPR) repeat protein